MANPSSSLSPAVHDALAWAERRFRGRRTRRLLFAGLVALLGSLLAGAAFSRVATLQLLLVAVASVPVIVLGCVAVARVLPVAAEARVWLADRAFQLDDRLVTALDPGAPAARFHPVLAEEVEARLLARRTAAGRPVREPARRRVRRTLRRWRLHLLVVLLLAALLLTHGVLGPRVVPTDAFAGVEGPPKPATPATGVHELTLVLEAGPDPEFVRGEPIACRLEHGAGPTLAPLDVHIHGDRGTRLAVEPLGVRLEAGAPLRFDLSPVLQTSGTDGPGRRTVVVRGRDPEGRVVESNPVAFRIRPPESGKGGGDGGGKQDRPVSPPPPPPEVGNKPEEKQPELPPPEGEPERTPLESTPRFVVPLLDEDGRVVEKKRYVVRFLPGGGVAVEPAGGEKAPAFRDLVERYRRHAEALMDRRGVPPAERELFLRYLRALEAR
jgi:hypothetical protein